MMNDTSIIDEKTEQVHALEQMLEMATDYMSGIEKELSLKHQNLSDTYEELRRSLEFSTILQKMIQPSSDHLEGIFEQHFILNKPKELIGGDHFWFRKKEGKSFLACMDCTGHGIPGAMLTMAAHFSMNAVYDQNDYNSPNSLLHAFNQQFFKHFHSDKNQDHLTFGLDIGLLMIDEKEQIIRYSGTHQPLVKTNKEGIKVFNGNRTYIGLPQLDLPNEHLIHYKKDDKFFLFTDGVPDQFGGPRNKKILKKRVFKVLKSSHLLNMNKQKEIVDSVLMDWKGNQEQTDDILMLGIKV